MRLPASLRIKASRDFARVRREGTSFPGRYVVVSVLRDPALTQFQFGLITTRKIGNAVVRNRTRRRLREVIREQQGRIAGGCYIVTIARWRAPEATLQELCRDWLGAAKRAGVLIDARKGNAEQGGGAASLAARPSEWAGGHALSDSGPSGLGGSAPSSLLP